MKKRYVILGLIAAGAASFAAGVVARPVGQISFTLENGGSSALQGLSMSRPHADAWGVDRLGGRRLEPGDSVRVVLEPTLGGCLYDMKAHFQSGGESRLFAVDVCRLNGSEIILSD